MKKIVMLSLLSGLFVFMAACSNIPKTDIASNAKTDTNLVKADTNMTKANSMKIAIGDTVLMATLVDNSSVTALKKELAIAPIKIKMRDYGNMEKVGSLGKDFPRNDESINAEAGDIILYQGNALVIYYDTNSWSFTRLGKIDNVTQDELKTILGKGDVTITLSLP